LDFLLVAYTEKLSEYNTKLVKSAKWQVSGFLIAYFLKILTCYLFYFTCSLDDEIPYFDLWMSDELCG
jgi:hypothetical protein